MSQLKIEEKKPVKICGFKQNCYKVGTHGGLVGLAQTPNVEQKKFPSLEKTMLPNGYIQEVVEKDYPINSKSVTSYADGADYRNDPAQAIANAPQRVNLGDITETQKFIDNPQNFLRLYDEVASKLKAYYSSMQETKEKEVTPNEQ